MLPLKIKINNLGKLTDADIRIGKFTVFAGPNNTGKTFVSKALYSIFGAGGFNHLAASMWIHIRDLQDSLKMAELDENFKQKKLLQKISDATSNLQTLIINISNSMEMNELDATEQVLPEIHNSLDDILLTFNLLPEEDKKILLKSSLMMLTNFEERFRNFKTKSSIGFILDGLMEVTINNFQNNFQVAKLSHLHDNDSTINIKIEKFCEINISDNSFSFRPPQENSKEFPTKAFRILREYSKTLFLDSPAFWQIKQPLDRIRKNPFSLASKNQLLGIPKYVYDLHDALDTKYVGKIICPDVLARLTSKEVLDGKIVMSELGELHFQEKKRTIPLSLAATGIANLGMLALLIERNILNKNTFLFIDEPETNLHPAWQVEMVEALYALSKAGVNVVIATHSADIMKWIEVHAKKNKEDAENNMEINHFRRDGTVISGEGELMDRIDAIQADLTDPYFSLFVDGL